MYENSNKKIKTSENKNILNDDTIEKHCAQAVENGATAARVVLPSSVVTSEWVRWKCQFGCPVFGMGHCCPPETPSPDKTRKFLDSYQRAILFHLEIPQSPEPESRKKLGKTFRSIFHMLTKLEGDLFKDGFYKAFLFLSGPCRLCKTCGKLKEELCKLAGKTRPSMESCGIDVFQTARNNGFTINTLSDKSETQNNYCLLMVD